MLTTFARRHAHWLLLALILVAGLALRFYRLGNLPPGLYRDEAFNGLDALDVIGGARPIFFSANNGREPLFIYLVSLSVGALGRTPLALRLPAAVVGGLTIVAAYALGRALYTPRLGLLAAAVTALTFWPVALSRIGLRAGTLPLVLALALACAAAGLRRPPGRLHFGLLALGGALCGLTFYTYLAARFVPLALFAFLVFWYSAQRPTFPNVRQLAAFAVPAALVALPLLIAGLAQPEILIGRVGQVSVLHPDINRGDLPGTLLRNVAAAVGMFFWRGDDIARHNLPGRPVFDGLLAVAFLAGAARLGWQAMAQRRLPAALLLLWVGTLLLPTILAEDTPHFLRAVGVLPAACLVAAAGLDGLWSAAVGWPALRRGVVVAALAASGLWTAYDYFGRYAAAPGTAYLFEAAATRLAERLRAEAAAGSVVYADRLFRDQFPSVRFLAGAVRGLNWIDPASPLPAQPAATRTVVVVWPYEPVAPMLAGLPVGHALGVETGPLHRGDLEPAPYPLYAVFTAQPAALLVGQHPAALARFEGGLELLACRVAAAPEGHLVELIWRATTAPSRDLQVFAQAQAGDGAVLAQADGPLGGEWLPSRLWRAGEIVVEQRTLVQPSVAGWTDALVHIGLYDLASGARLLRLDAPGEAFVVSATYGR